MNPLARILIGLALAVPVAAGAQMVRPPPPIVVRVPTVIVTVRLPPPTATNATLRPVTMTPAITVTGTTPEAPAAPAPDADPEANAANAAGDTPPTEVETAPRDPPVQVVAPPEPLEPADADDGECEPANGNAVSDPSDCGGNERWLDGWMIVLLLGIGVLLLLWILKIRRH